MYMGIAGLLLAVVGVAALLYPIYLDQYDVYGIAVSCGTGLRSNLTQAAQANHHDLVAQCDTALLVRRAWAIPAIAVGWLLVTGFLMGWVHSNQSEPKFSQVKLDSFN
jgi:hypothetical protein